MNQQNVNKGIINNATDSWLEYEMFDNVEWRKDFFSTENGGYLVTSRRRIEEALKNTKERQKFACEHACCLVFARSGLKIWHYEDNKPDGTYDIVCNGLKGDIKRVKGSCNVVKYAKYAIREQGAEIVLFELLKWNNKMRDAISEMIRKNIHGYYYVTGIDKVHSF